jgi:hypothetical protein
MMKHLRLATAEEVEKLRKDSDYTRNTVVFAMDQNEGEPDFAVVRTVIDLDPVHYGKSTNDVQKAKFMYALEERLAGMGIDQVYYSVADSDARWKAVIKNWGAEEVSPVPERRFKKVLS